MMNPGNHTNHRSAGAIGWHGERAAGDRAVSWRGTLLVIALAVLAGAFIALMISGVASAPPTAHHHHGGAHGRVNQLQALRESNADRAGAGTTALAGAAGSAQVRETIIPARGGLASAREANLRRLIRKGAGLQTVGVG